MLYFGTSLWRSNLGETLNYRMTTSFGVSHAKALPGRVRLAAMDELSRREPGAGPLQGPPKIAVGQNPFWLLSARGAGQGEGRREKLLAGEAHVNRL